MTSIRFGRVVELITTKASDQSFQVGLESVESATGRLLNDGGAYDSDGIAFQPGDVLFGKLRPYLAKSWLADRAGNAVGDFHVFRPGTETHPRYVSYFTLSKTFLDPVVSSVYGAKMPRAAWDFIRNVEVRVPSLAEQQSIADYLDRETVQIDTLIAKQEQLIATLRERRTVIADEVLGHNVALGCRLKWSAAEIDSRAGTGWSDLPLLSVSISWGVRRRDEVSGDQPRAEDLSHYKTAVAGQLVINRMRAFQGALGVAPQSGVVSPDYAVLQTAENIDPMWLAALMRTTRFVGEMSSRLKGIGGVEGGSVRTPRLNVTDLLDISVRIPTLAEQADQLALLTMATSAIDTLIAKAERFITLAKERRSALITAAVTGQIDVGAAA